MFACKPLFVALEVAGLEMNGRYCTIIVLFYAVRG